MPDILHRISIDAPRQRVHDLIATTDGIARWWSGAPLSGVHSVGASFNVYFGGREQPAAVMQVVSDDPDRVVWRVTDGPEPWIGTRITFALRPRGVGGTTLLFTHADWPEASEFMSGCSTNWGAYLTSLKNGAETGAFGAYPAGEVSRWDGADPARLERMYEASPELVWELLTTAAGLNEWWAPDGFETRVSDIDLRPGGQLHYTMTATGPEQIEFMRSNGSPLTVELRKTITEVAAPSRLAYRSLIDFVPDHESYEHLTTIDITPDGEGTTVVMTIDPLHDGAWTSEYRAHRANELDHLGAAISRRTG